MLFSLPPGTEMFHFPGFPPPALYIQAGVTPHHGCRVPPFGHPRINARLTAPRGLSRPPTSFIGSWYQGIHHAPFITYTHPPTRRVHTAATQGRHTHAAPRRGRAHSRAAHGPRSVQVHQSTTTQRPRNTTRPLYGPRQDARIHYPVHKHPTKTPHPPDHPPRTPPPTPPNPHPPHRRGEQENHRQGRQDRNPAV
jgi:hypothetical protein